MCHNLSYRVRGEIEESLIKEQLDKLLTEYVESKVKQVLASEHVQASLAQRLQVRVAASDAWLHCC